MKKKLALLLGALVAAITLTACGTDPKEADYNGKTYQELETEMNQYVSVIGMLHSSVASFMEQNNMKPEDFDYSQMTSEETIESYKSYGVNEQELAAVESWDNIVAQYGELDRTDAILLQLISVCISRMKTESKKKLFSKSFINLGTWK